MSQQKIVIFMGSQSDYGFASTIGHSLEEYEVNHEYHVASAHRTPEDLLRLLKKFEKAEGEIVYITVAGLSDALSGVVAGFTRYPVIACPPDSEKYGWAKVFSSAMTPKDVAVSFVFKPENAALAAVKILALSNSTLREKIRELKGEKAQKLR